MRAILFAVTCRRASLSPRRGIIICQLRLLLRCWLFSIRFTLCAYADYSLLRAIIISSATMFCYFLLNIIYYDAIFAVYADAIRIINTTLVIDKIGATR